MKKETIQEINGVGVNKETLALLQKGRVQLDNGLVLYVQIKMTGKMFGIVSISTSPITNTFCIAHRGIENCVCKHCFSVNNSKMYKDHEKLMLQNSEILKNYHLSDRDLRLINYVLRPYKYIRIEAFGDIENNIQLDNYFNIIKSNPDCYFGFWTKNFGLMINYLRQGNKWPKNATLVLSNYLLDTELESTFLNVFRKYVPNNQLKTFSVFKNPTNQNCLKSCLNCLKCYTKNNTQTIIEKLK